MIPRTVALQAPLSLELPRQEYWSGFPFPTPWDLPHPGIKPAALASPGLEADSLTTGAIWEAPEKKESESIK